MRIARVAALGLVLGLVALVAGGYAELTREEMNQAKALISSSDPAQQIQGVRILARGNDRSSVDLLVKMLASGRLSGDVREAVIDALGETTDEDALDAIVKSAGRGDWSVRADLIAALVKTKSSKAEDALLKYAESRSDPLVQTVAIDALGEMKSQKAIGPIGDVLTGRTTPWQVKVAAIHALARIFHNDCVDPLIEALDKESEGRVKEEIEQGLHALTGKTMPTVEVWKSWWSANKSRPLEGPGFNLARNPERGGPDAGGPAGEKGGSVVEPTYYGQKIRSKRLVFVIDVSTSMLTELGRAPNIPAPVVSGGAGARQPQGPDYSKAKSKLDLAKIELAWAIKNLPQDAAFNVVWYGSNVRTWKDGLVPATPSNKADAIKTVENLQPDGLTDIHGGLEKAFSLHSGKGMGNESGGPPAVTGADYQQGADTIYFLTDGWPTTGKTLNGVTPQNTGDMQNAVKYRAELLKVVGEWLRVRKVRINTVGISEQPGGYDEELLKGLSNMSGGTFVAP